MYNILNQYLSINQIAMIGILLTFLITFWALKHPLPFLPSDQGRDFAVNGQLSKGKLRGVGLTFVVCYIIGSILFLPLDKEYIIYILLLICIMMSGYLDDAAEKPWSEYKKGLIDLILSAMAVLTFLNFNSTTIFVGSLEFDIPRIVYMVLGIVLFWCSINVTNCSDGVDGLCASLCCVTLLSFSFIFRETLGHYVISNFLFTAALFAYLYFNTSPSSMLMGDAGSRALGFYIAIIAIKSQQPFIYLLLAGILIVDGGLGLVKVFLKRFLGISILKNTRTPIHDHVRKKFGWSDTQVVVRFLIMQVLLAILASTVIT